jgi:hypothetical protein
VDPGVLIILECVMLLCTFTLQRSSVLLDHPLIMERKGNL